MVNIKSGSNGEYIAYDLNGNIVHLIRTRADTFNNPVDMDILNYTYENGNNNSNRLMRVEDSTSVYNNNGFQNGNIGTDDYSYDANGNMTQDKNKDITSISYNFLNLPEQITFGNGNMIEYIYNAMGMKVKKTVNQVYPSTNTSQVFTDYLDGFQYVGGMLNFFPTAEGYVRATSMTEDPANPQLVFNYVYNYTDHLGNIRLSYTKDPVSGELKIMEENHYYPFGLKHKVYGSFLKQDYLKEEEANGDNGARPGIVISSPYNYKYNGKELQDELGLSWYDYGARNYDPALGRWMNIDPLAPKYFSYSPYTYALNNPVYFIDPDGMQVENGDPDEEKLPTVELPGVVIVGKVPKKESSSSSSGSIYISWLSDYLPDIDVGVALFGDYRGAQRAFLSNPSNREWYYNFHKNDNRNALIVGGTVIGIVLLPEMITFGSLAVASEAEMLSLYGSGAFGTALASPLGEIMLKSSLDISAQALFKPAGDINPVASLAGAMVPGSSYGSGVLSGVVNESTTLIMEYSINPENVGAKEVLTSGVKSAIAAPGGMYMGNFIEGVVGNKAAGSAGDALFSNYVDSNLENAK